MSAGPFQNTFYELSTENGGGVASCRVQPETLTAEFDGADNSPPAGPTTVPGSATSSQGRRSAGINMRTVSIRWTGTPPAGYLATGILRIPVLRPAVFSLWTPGTAGTYLGQPAQIVGRSPEVVR